MNEKEFELIRRLKKRDQKALEEIILLKKIYWEKYRITLTRFNSEIHSEIFPAQPDRGQSVGFHYVFDHTLMNETTSSNGHLDL